MLALLAAALVLCFPALVLSAAFSDAISFTIPNWIPLALLALFPVAGLAVGVSLPALGLQLAVGLGFLVVGAGMFALGWMGGGDAKLIAAVVLWLGVPALPTFLVATAMTGGMLALSLLMLRSAHFRAAVALGPRWVNRLADSGEGIPYGVAIAVGALFAFTASPFGVALGL
ncbi:MAG: prepilin peptidase [Alphaproteobacteria bacterium]|nr:prepilin peptidase [Alphaproteobacteria bacterium]MBU1516708.1 prepilin peptidase [Alphaproteobacteria bacterium]MBU2095918.1 prepilin peptidase [Alphaproteobacteria bacterium]MBU2153622.1 prepilin peptidase [Alphaproteobacteria bacterium]MBU2307334.1 prepilin peptidase [Alphaproteobacteria bacterium]